MSRLFSILIFSVAMAGFSGCGKSEKTFKVEGYTQGTTYQVTYLAKTESVSKMELDNVLMSFSKSLSTYDSTSLISAINQNKTDIADELILTVLKRSLEFSEISDGALDVTVAPLVNAYGFGFKNIENANRVRHDSIMELVGYRKIKISGNRILKENPATMLDFNAIAQGYSVDVVSQFLDDKGIENYFIEIGGEIFTKGHNPKKEKWKVGIETPDTTANHGFKKIIPLSGKALATSGNYKKFYIKDGKFISHTINPKTGFLVLHDLLSATIIAKNCMDADAMATICMVLGRDEAKKLLAKLPEYSAYFIYSENGELKEEFVNFEGN